MNGCIWLVYSSDDHKVFKFLDRGDDSNIPKKKRKLKDGTPGSNNIIKPSISVLDLFSLSLVSGSVLSDLVHSCVSFGIKLCLCSMLPQTAYETAL